MRRRISSPATRQGGSPHQKLPAAFSGPARGILERTGDVGDVSSLAMCDCRSGGWPQARPMDQRIESFLADVLALAGEEPDVVRDEVRVALGDCEEIFRAQETH
jgi:hypothetical protein